jgi:hypothetical protein
MSDRKETDDIFQNLEKEFRRVEGARRRRGFFAVLGAIAGFFAVIAGLSTSFFVSVIGYGVMFGCVLLLAERVKDRTALRITQAAQRAREQQAYRRSTRPRFYREQ